MTSATEVAVDTAFYFAGYSHYFPTPPAKFHSLLLLS